jgi:PAS fold.
MDNRKLIEPSKWCTTFDENGNVITTVYDESFRKLMGYGPENDDANVSWTESIHPDDAERVAAYFADCCLKHPEGMDYDIEYRMMTKNGYHWFHDLAHCERRDDGSIIRMDGFVFDIQEGLDKTEIIKSEKLRSDVFEYLNNHDDDPVELLRKFAPHIREMLDCDQIIYRDLEEVRIMVNSPEVEKTWAVPIEFCQQCEHLDPHHPMYAGGYTEMENCQEGWQGIPFTRTVR